MSETQRLRRKDLKGPDELQHATQWVFRYVSSHEREVAFAALALVVVVAVVIGVRGYRGWRDGQASDAFRLAFQAYVAEDLATAAKGFVSVVEGWPGSRWSELALVYRGEIAQRRGDRKEAAAAFASLLDTTEEPTLRQIGEYNLGIVMRAAGDPVAADHFHRAAKIQGPLQAAAVIAIAAGPSDSGDLDAAQLADLEPVLPPELREFIGRNVEN